MLVFGYTLCLYISTHDLTRRSTDPKVIVYVLLIFQLTTSRGGRLKLAATLALELYFNSRPHEEVDCSTHLNIHDELLFQLTTSRGGRPISSFIFCNTFFISTHDLTRRSTMYEANSHNYCTFQLTTSRGGRLSLPF